MGSRMIPLVTIINCRVESHDWTTRVDTPNCDAFELPVRYHASGMAVTTTTTAQTPRRSKRHHPVVFTSGNPFSLSEPRQDKWASRPLHTRDTISADLADDDDDDATADASTAFYPYFLRSLRATDEISKAASAKFSIGDTVLLATNIRRPSIGIIIALWEVSRPLTDAQMFAKVHWFLRPTELARSRKKREHLEVCLLIPFLSYQ
jgi:hypothetical protein